MDRPNILIFMTDQQRGNTVLPESPALTPNLDRFAAEGVTFSNAFCPAPHCCPSRATFLTGLYPTRHGVWNNVGVPNALSTGLNPGVRLWSEDLEEAGYSLDFSGKWHISKHERPADRGWREHAVTGICGKGAEAEDIWRNYRQAAGSEKSCDRSPGQILRPGYGDYSHYGTNEHPFGDNDVVAAAVDVLRNRQDSDGPWCQYIGPLGPHDPYTVPQRFLDLYHVDDIELPSSFDDDMTDKPGLYRRTRDAFSQLTEAEHRDAIRHYLAFCSYEDHLFGQVLEALDESGQAENTLVLYTSDHGDYLGDHGLWCKGLPCFRGAYEVPAVIRWPDKIRNPGRREGAFITLADFAPTFLEMAGISFDADARHFAGRSLAPFFRNESPADWPDAFFTQSNGNELYGIQRSVMTQDWKLVYNGFDYDELYDLKNDPEEMVNRAGDPAGASIIEELYRRLWRFAAEQNDDATNGYIMVALATHGPGVAFQS